MEILKIDDVKHITKRKGAHAGIVLLFDLDTGEICGASYGKDRATCKRARSTMCNVIDAIENEIIDF